MSNKIANVQKLGIYVPEGAQHVDHNGGKAYLLQPTGDAPLGGRDSGKQTAIINAAARETGVSLYRINSIDGIGASVSASKSYLSKDFAGRKGYGVYWRVMRVDAYLAQFEGDEAEAERDALPNSLRQAEGAALVVMHAWHDKANDGNGLGRAPQSADVLPDTEAARLLGFADTASQPAAKPASKAASKTGGKSGQSSGKRSNAKRSNAKG